MTNAKSNASTTRKAPAKKAAPAKKSAPAKAPAPKPEQVTVPVPDFTASVKMAATMKGARGAASSHRLYTEKLAELNGYRIILDPPFDNVLIFERGDLRLRVTYSNQDYVRKVEGAYSIEPGEQRKWKRLNAALVVLAQRQDATA